jgi:hypothetical protein
MADATARTGGCLCGAVRYAVHGTLRPVVACHCTQCRRTTGHFLAATAVRHGNFKLLVDSGLKWYASSSEARRGFCAVCGSTLFWEGVGLDYISIAAGTLDDSTGLATVCHIHVADKGAYYEIEPGVPQSQDGSFAVPLPAA